MTRRRASPPAGYASARVGDAEVVARGDALTDVVTALAEGTLHEYAERHPAAFRFQGRVAAFAAPLPRSGTRVVVRHSYHGGVFAWMTGDRFLPPTRGPHELATAVRLASLGIPTPTVLAYVVYRAGWVLRRSDVATVEIPGGVDLAGILAGATAAIGRDQALDAAAALLRTMARVGVRHPDLNLKNVLVAAASGGAATAYLLDVDRVTIQTPGTKVAAANAARIARSAERWRTRYGAPIQGREVAALSAAARGEA